MRIQHNIAAMNAYRNYNLNTSAVSKNLEKLSSGYRINRAGDDAAGLAISEKMRAQITGLDAASKNVKDGISLVKTAEGAMQEVQDMLNRMVNLATQSANGTYDNEVDRANLQKEVDQLRSEINRIADSSNFNGIKLLDGSLDGGSGYTILEPTDIAKDNGTAYGFSIVADGQLAGKNPQKGIYSVDFSQATLTNNSTGAISVSFKLTAAVSVNLSIDAGSSLEGEKLAKAIADELAKLNGSTIYAGDTMTYSFKADGGKVVVEMDNIPKTKDEATKVVFDAAFTAGVGSSKDTQVASNTGNQFEVYTEQEAAAKAAKEYAQAVFTLGNTQIKDGSAVKIGDTTYVFALGKDSKYKDFENVIDLTDQKIASSGTLTAEQLNLAGQRLVQAARDNKQFFVGSKVNDAGNSITLSLTEKDGGIDYLVNNLAGEDGLGSMNGGSTALDSNKNTNEAWQGLLSFGQATLKAGTGKALTLQIGDTSESFNQLKVNIGDIHTAALGIDKISIANQTSAAAAVNQIKDAINTVSSIRGTLGATQNRLEHTQNNLSVMKENIQDAESTIRDTDVAEEMMAYTKNNILVQSAQAMLAQANQIPQGVLQLLG